MTNGETLADVLSRGAKNLMEQEKLGKADLIASVYEKALGRKPTTKEAALLRELGGQPVQQAGLEDVLWTVTMLPEFQLIY